MNAAFRSHYRIPRKCSSIVANVRGLQLARKKGVREGSAAAAESSVCPASGRTEVAAGNEGEAADSNGAGALSRLAPSSAASGPWDDSTT